MLQERRRNSGWSLINIISQFTLNLPTHWGRNLSILRTKHPGMNRVIEFMLFNSARNAQICTLGRQNNLSIIEWHNTGGPTPRVRTLNVHLHLEEKNHSFEENNVKQLINHSHLGPPCLKNPHEGRLDPQRTSGPNNSETQSSQVSLTSLKACSSPPVSYNWRSLLDESWNIFNKLKVDYDTAARFTMVTMTWMTENLHQHVATPSNTGSE